jgi:voltage-gated sodium channel
VGAPAYFVSFILFGTMIVLNLFIGVIMNSMQEAAFESQQATEKKRLASRPGSTVSLQHEVTELIRRHRELLEHLARLEKRTAQEHEG